MPAGKIVKYVPEETREDDLLIDKFDDILKLLNKINPLIYVDDFETSNILSDTDNYEGTFKIKNKKFYIFFQSKKMKSIIYDFSNYYNLFECHGGKCRYYVDAKNDHWCISCHGYPTPKNIEIYFSDVSETRLIKREGEEYLK